MGATDTQTQSQLKFSRELVSEVWAEALSLIPDNHAETGALPKDLFSPSLAEYIKLEMAGVLTLFTARKGGQLVGYSAFVMGPHPDYPSTYFAKQAVTYLQPEFRGFGGVKFILWVDETLKGDGVTHVLRHSTKRCDYSRTLDRMGYAETETVYIRAL